MHLLRLAASLCEQREGSMALPTAFIWACPVGAKTSGWCRVLPGDQTLESRISQLDEMEDERLHIKDHVASR
ncbi:hypothetical protein O181_044704 [Austropuccinia psidii MF-1]|uniref:Uncharacterized protein n=1 Tax=Austropuccinia psidii MF-1 TaxID=1389203 RepID=A0A9Q3DKS2_9BASI|nr:hypothetical protein [Austropuccinia psidii MF-1]